MSKEYCTWARDAVENYYNKLLTIEAEYPHTDLRMKRGQIAWTYKELTEWTARIKEYQ